MAAEELRPDPSGTQETNAASKPLTCETGLAKRPGHAGRVGGPAVHATGFEAVEVGFGNLVGRHVGDDADLGVFARLERDERAVRQRDRQAQARVVVGVLADQVHTARSGPHALGRGGVGVDEQLGRPRDAILVGQRLNEFNSSHWCFSLCDGYICVDSYCQSEMSIGPSSWKRLAMSSGVVSEIQAAMPDSEPARYLILLAARRNEKNCRFRR